MTQRLELDTKFSSLPYPNLRDENVVKKLINQGRMPIIVARDFEKQLANAVCFIPAGEAEPSTSFNLGISEAGEIARIIFKIVRTH